MNKGITDYNMLLDIDNKYYHNLSVDVVIFGYHDRSLRVLLMRPSNVERWMLPGGYIRRDQTVEEAAVQVVQDRTRLLNLSLYQSGVYSQPGRTRGQAESLLPFFEKIGLKPTKDYWMFNDFVSVSFFAFVESSKVFPSGDYVSEECQWFDVFSLPEILYDHKDMIVGAMSHIRNMAYFHPFGYTLLPQKFTLPEIHSLYETILGRKLDERNFSKKLVKLGIIIKLDEVRNIGAHRSPYLYMFCKDRYDELRKKNDVIIL